MADPVRLAVLVSGGGTTLQNLLDRQAVGRLAGKVVGVVSSRADVPAVGRAERAGVHVVVVPRRKEDEGMPGLSFSDRVWAALRAFRPDLVCMAGWLHLLPVPADHRHRVMNVHPSLLPAFGGKGMYGHHVHEAVLKHGAKVSGCTVHLVDDTYDTGPILVQKCVPVREADDPDTLAARVFGAECEAYPEAIELLASGRVVVRGRRAVVAG